MKAGQNFGLLYFLLVIGQIILCNYAQLGPYVILTMLPAMVLCIPANVNTISSMIIAFISGLSVDWLSEGIIGLNAAALVPVAFARRSLIKIFLGEDLITRGEKFSYRKQGFAKVSMAHATCLAIFLGLYIFLDGAGTRPTWFCLSRFGISFACNFLLTVIVTDILAPDDRK